MSEKGYCIECRSWLAPMLEGEERELCFSCERELKAREEENKRLQELDEEDMAQCIYETEQNIAKEEAKQQYPPGNYSILKVEYVEVRTLDDDCIDVEHKKIE